MIYLFFILLWKDEAFAKKKKNFAFSKMNCLNFQKAVRNQIRWVTHVLP